MFQTAEVSRCLERAKGQISDRTYWMRYDINVWVTAIKPTLKANRRTWISSILHAHVSCNKKDVWTWSCLANYIYYVVFGNKLRQWIMNEFWLNHFYQHLVLIINMSRFACSAPNEDQRNVIVHEVDGRLCFKTCKDISQGTELLVYPEVSKILNEPVKNYVVNTTGELCNQEAPQRAREDESLKPAHITQDSEGEGM